jgi:hypothetical protein
MKIFSYILLLAVIPSNIAVLCPILPAIDRNTTAKIEVGAKTYLVKYFEASKKGDAKMASSLIDYDEWAKEMNLQGEAKKQWIEMHKGSLQEDYDMQKNDGSTKEYKILSSELKDKEAVFKVSQQRASGVYIWEVKLFRKQAEGKGAPSWRIKGFYLKGVEGQGGQIIQINN